VNPRDQVSLPPSSQSSASERASEHIHRMILPKFVTDAKPSHRIKPFSHIKDQAIGLIIKVFSLISREDLTLGLSRFSSFAPEEPFCFVWLIITSKSEVLGKFQCTPLVVVFLKYSSTCLQSAMKTVRARGIHFNLSISR
jgi:hypothetical protein